MQATWLSDKLSLRTFELQERILLSARLNSPRVHADCSVKVGAYRRPCPIEVLGASL